MAATVSLLTLASGAAEGCSLTAETLNGLSSSIGTGRATFSSMAAECLVTKDVLERLETFLNPGTRADSIVEYHDQDQLRTCLESLVRPINAILNEVDTELSRLRRYSAEQDPAVQSKLVLILQDCLYDARSSLRKNRSSLSIIMDCVKR